MKPLGVWKLHSQTRGIFECSGKPAGSREEFHVIEIN